MSYITYKVQVYRDGTQAWYKDDKLHREDGPALVYSNGTQYWYQNGKLHREDGPAIIYRDGYQCWYLNDVKLTEEEYLARTQGKELTVAEIEKLLGHKVKVIGQD